MTYATKAAMLQTASDLGQVQSELERIADLEPALRRIIAPSDAYNTMHAADGDDIARMIEYGDAFRNARAVLAGKAAPRLTDRQIDNVTRLQWGGDLDLVLAYRQFARAIEAKVRGTP